MKEEISKAEQLKAIRKEKNLSTKDIAEHCGVSIRTVEGWEQGRGIPGPAWKLICIL